MWKKVLKTDNSITPIVLRLTLALVMFPHGAQKVLGWFGGYGFSGTLAFFTQQMGIPTVFALLAFAAEFLGPIALLIGFKTRIAAFGIGFTMLVASSMHWSNGFFMKWSERATGEGFEYHILAIGIAIALVITGAGRCSIDRKLTEKWGL